MRQLLATVVILASLGIGTLFTQPLISAAVPSRPAVGSAGRKTVLVERCRIKLIDEVVLSSHRVGILVSVEPQEGDSVQAGQEVAVLNDEVAQATYATALKKADNNVNVRYTEKASAVAEVEYQKALKVNDDVPGAVPGIEVLRLKLAAERAVLSIEQAEHEFAVNTLLLAEAKADLKTYRVEAPFDGIVTRVHKQKGEAVGQGDPILEVISTRTVRVEGHVDIKDALEIKAGAPVKVRLDLPNHDLTVEREVFDGRIVLVDPTVTAVLEQVRVWAKVTNRNNILRAGLTAEMTIDVTKQIASN